MDEPLPSSPAAEPQQIGGVLVLPAIGLVLGPILTVISLVASIGLFGEMAAAGLGRVFTLQVVSDAITLLCGIPVVFSFFRRRRSAPSLLIGLIVLRLALLGLMAISARTSGIPGVADLYGKQLVQAGVVAGIWIPYFLSSKRVKATFVT